MYHLTPRRRISLILVKPGPAHARLEEKARPLPNTYRLRPPGQGPTFLPMSKPFREPLVTSTRIVPGSRLGPGLPTGVVYLIVIFVSVIILGGNPGCNGSLVSRRPPGRKHAAARTRDSAGQGCELHKLANRSKGLAGGLTFLVGRHLKSNESYADGGLF